MASNVQSARLGIFSLRRGRKGPDWTDWLSYLYLFLGVIVMLGPVVWLAISSFKSPANLSEFPPTPLPYAFRSVVVEGYDKPLNLYDVRLEDGTTKRMAQVRRVGIQAQMVDPAQPLPGYHGQGVRLRRPGDPLPRIMPVVRVRVVTGTRSP